LSHSVGDAARRADAVLVELHRRLAGVDVVLELLFGVRLLVAVAAPGAEVNVARQAVKRVRLGQLWRVARRIDRLRIRNAGEFGLEHVIYQQVRPPSMTRFCPVI
jgi:hypothetical protein